MKVLKLVKNGTRHIYAPGLNLSSLVVKVYYRIYFRVTPVLHNNYYVYILQNIQLEVGPSGGYGVCTRARVVHVSLLDFQCKFTAISSQL